MGKTPFFYKLAFGNPKVSPVTYNRVATHLLSNTVREHFLFLNKHNTTLGSLLHGLPVWWPDRLQRSDRCQQRRQCGLGRHQGGRPGWTNGDDNIDRFQLTLTLILH